MGLDPEIKRIKFASGDVLLQAVADFGEAVSHRRDAPARSGITALADKLVEV
jgi:hypothetical protein